MVRAIGLVLSVVAFVPQGTPAALQSQSQSQGTASISGTVTRVDNDKPVSGALVQLQRVGANRSTETPTPTARTDESGTFRIEQLPAGAYMVLVSADRYFPADATTTRPSGTGKRVDLTAGQQLEKFNVTLVPASAIEGRALDEFGDPAPGVTMAVAQVTTAMGRSRLLPVSLRPTPVTDDRGMFRISGLAPGDYYVLALSGQFGTQAGAALSTPVDTRAGFAPTYFPGTANAVDAAPVHLAVGRETTGLTLGLVPSRLFTVSGRVTDPSGGSPAGPIQLLQTQGGDIRAIVPANGTIAADGRFTYRNIPQGSYVLQARTPRGFGSALITVHDRDVTGVAIEIVPPRTARGHVTFDSGTPPPKENVRIAVGPTNFVTGPVSPTPGAARSRINDDWTFELSGLQNVGVVVAQATPNWQLRRVTLAGEDITDKPYDFRRADVADLEIVLSDRWGSVEATVTDLAGQLAADSTVIVFSEDATKWTFPSRYIAIGRTNQQGVVTLGRLPAGSYLAVAVPQGVAPGTEVDAVVLESLRAASTRVALTEGSTSSVPLKSVR